MELRCPGTLKTRHEPGHFTTNLTTTVVLIYKSLKNDVKPVLSLTLYVFNIIFYLSFEGPVHISPYI